MKSVLFLLVFSNVFFCRGQNADREAYFPKKMESVTQTKPKTNVWIFIMAGQSNMAGRGLVEVQDTVLKKRLLTVDKNGQLIFAKEPLHYYEPSLTGLDCGYSFGTAMIDKIPDSISILLIPVAVGGSSISQWLGDSIHRNVQLFSNFVKMVEVGKQYGTIKGILWHQGESDANEKDIPYYTGRLTELFNRFRYSIGNKELPVLIGELGSFAKDKVNFDLINQAIKSYVASDKNTVVIPTGDLEDKGDSLHFNSKGQRMMGERFAAAYLKNFHSYHK